MEFAFRMPTEQIERAIDEIGDRRALPAIARSLNRAAVSTRVVLARNISEDMGLKVGTVRDQIVISEARPVADRLRARLMVTGEPIPLIDFNARASKRGGVIARLPAPGKGRYPFAFIGTMPNKKVGVFARTRFTRGTPIYGRRGNPKLERIEQLHGPSLPRVFNKYAPAALVRGEESLLKNLASELAFAQSREA